MPIFSMSASGRVTVSAGSGAIGGQLEELRRRAGVGADGGHDAELQHLAGQSRIGDVEVVRRLAAAERLVGAEIAEDVVADRDVREVDDHVRPLGQPHQEPVAETAVRFTGSARNPPSLPICHTSTPGMFAKSRMRKRDWHPLRNRNR